MYQLALKLLFIWLGRRLSTVDLYKSCIDDSDLRAFQGIKNIDLPENDEMITDIGLSYLRKVREINLSCCNQTTEKSLKQLGNAKIIK
jgi:hypothetical protein